MSIYQRLSELASTSVGKLTKNEHVKRYFFNTGWMFADRIIRIISLAILGIIIARYLGPTDYGYLSIALAYIAIFVPISGLGLGDLAARELVRQRYSENELLGTLMYLRFSASFLSVSALFIAITLSKNAPIVKAIVPFLSFSIIFQSFDIVDRFFQSHVKAKYSARSSVIALSLSTLIKIGLIIFEAPLLYFAIAYALEFVFQAIALSVHFKMFKRRFSDMVFNTRLALEFLKDSWALAIASVMVMLYTRIDQFMIDDMIGPAAVGNFAAAVKISEATYIIPFTITNSLMPAFVRGLEMGTEIFKQRVQQLYDLLTWLALPIAVMVSIFAPVIALLFGDKFIGVDDVLSIHIWAMIFVSWGSIVSKWYVIERMPKFITINTVIGALINISLNYFMIPAYGIKGAAIATIIAHFFAVVVVPAFFSKPRMLIWLMLRSLNPLAAFQRIKTLRGSGQN